MRKKTAHIDDGYTDEPLGELGFIEDFLPPPDRLVLREDTVKVTLALNKRSVEFFKKQAKKHHTHYQKMIRALVDQYARNFREEKPRR